MTIGSNNTFSTYATVISVIVSVRTSRLAEVSETGRWNIGSLGNCHSCKLIIASVRPVELLDSAWLCIYDRLGGGIDD